MFQLFGKKRLIWHKIVSVVASDSL